MAIKGDCKITLEEAEEKKENKGKGALAAVSDSSMLLFILRKGNFAQSSNLQRNLFHFFFTFFGLMNGLPGCEDGDQEPYSGELKTQQYHRLALGNISDYCLLNYPLKI